MGLIESLTAENRRRLEAISTKKRSMLGFKAYEFFPAEVLVEHFQAKVFTTETMPNAEPEQVELLCSKDDWSAGVILKNSLYIIHTSRHTLLRQQSNLMHEFAHIILDRKMVKSDPTTGLFQRRQKDEDEAVYLGGCLQIPRRGLLWSVQQKMSLSQIALHFNASEEMVRFRSNVNGISVSC